MIPVDARLAASENCSVNQVTVSRATSRSAPDSSNKWLAPGITDSDRGASIRDAACSLRCSTSRSFSPDDEQRGGGDAREPAIREIGPAAARHHGGDEGRLLGGGDQRRRRSRARAEVSERRGPGKRLLGGPPRRGEQAACEQGHVEARPGVGCLLFGEQIEQQRRDPRPLQRPRDLQVTGARAARAAAVREDHQPARAIGDREDGREIDVVDVEDQLLGADGSGLRLVGLLRERSEDLFFMPRSRAIGVPARSWRRLRWRAGRTRTGFVAPSRRRRFCARSIAVSGSGVRLGLGAQASDVVFELSPRGAERVTDGDVRVGVGAVLVG